MATMTRSQLRADALKQVQTMARAQAYYGRPPLTRDHRHEYIASEALRRLGADRSALKHVDVRALAAAYSAAYEEARR